MKLKTGRWYHLYLYDHCQYEGMPKESVEKSGDVVVNFVGKVEGQDTLYYYVRLVNCNEKGNSLWWRVIKKTLTEDTKEVEV